MHSTVGMGHDDLPNRRESRRVTLAVPSDCELLSIFIWPVPAPVRDLYLDPDFGPLRISTIWALASAFLMLGPF